MRTITKTLYTYGELLELARTTEGPEHKRWRRAVEKARQWLEEGEYHYEWWEDVYEQWKEALGQIGFYDIDICFEGFSYQGNGASFTAKCYADDLIRFLTTPLDPYSEDYVGGDGDRRRWLLYKIQETAPLCSDSDVRNIRRLGDLVVPTGRLTIEIVRTDSHYYHEHTCKAEVEFQDTRWNHTKDRPGQPRLTAAVEALQETLENFRLDLCRAIYADLEQEDEWLRSDENLEEKAEGNEYTFNDEGERED